MASMKRVCKICGVAESDHHEPDWLMMPDGCVCDFRSWDYETMTEVPPACAEYKGNGRENCHTCEHDEQCHQ